MTDSSLADATIVDESKILGEEWPEIVDLVINLPSKNSIVLPSVSTSDTLNALRQTLCDFQETAFLTAFKWSLAKLEDSTGNDIPHEEGEVNDFTELAALVKPGVRKVVLEAIHDTYDLKKVRTHVKRLRDTINSTFLLSASPSNQTPATEEEPIEKKKENTIPKVDSLSEVPQLGSYFSESFQVAGKDFPQTIQKSALTGAVKGVFLSGWNPAPATRRIQGDLAYVEVTLATEGTIYVTASARYILIFFFSFSLSYIF